MLGPGHAAVRGNEIADKLARGGSVQKFIGPEQSLGVSRQKIKNKTKLWVDNLHLVKRRGPCSTHRQDGKLISGLTPVTKARLLSFNRTQSRVVTGLLTEHHTLRRYLYVKGLNKTPLVGSVVMRRKPQSTFCVSVRPWLQSDMYVTGEARRLVKPRFYQ